MRLFFIVLISFCLSLFTVTPAFAQVSEPTSYSTATVIKINNQGFRDIGRYKNYFQNITIELTSGKEKGKKVDIDHGGVLSLTEAQRLNPQDSIIVSSTKDNSGIHYGVMDSYRLPTILVILLAFFLLVIAVAGKKGLGSIVGLGISLFVIMKFIVPQILAGNDPLLVSIVGAIVIMISTIYLAHGFSKQTSVAVIATALSLSITGVLAYIFVSASRLTGMGDESSFLLQFGQNNINIQGLLLGGIIIGSLGVLDDITTTQSATVFQLANTNEKLSFKSLFSKSFVIGKEHIVSLVNTLVLAYAGASLAIFILFEINPTHQPYWVILNSEVITEEIVRTLAGSIGLILAIPLTTLLATFVCKYKIKFS